MMLFVFPIVFGEFFQSVEQILRVGNLRHVVVLGRIEPSVSADQKSGHEIEHTHPEVTVQASFWKR